MVSPGWSLWGTGESEAQREEAGALGVSESLSGQGSPGTALGSGLGWAPTGEAWAWVLLPGLCPLLGTGWRPLQALAAQRGSSAGVRSPFGRGTQGLPFRLTARLGSEAEPAGATGSTGASQPRSALAGIGHMDPRRPRLSRLWTLLAPPVLGLCKQKPIWGCVPHLSGSLGRPFPLSGHRSSDLVWEDSALLRDLTSPVSQAGFQL